jgi:hypothetical protein
VNIKFFAPLTITRLAYLTVDSCIELTPIGVLHIGIESDRPYVPVDVIGFRS